MIANVLNFNSQRAPELINSNDLCGVRTINQEFEPKLCILEHPMDKIRFRYHSEMRCSHGALYGANSTQKLHTFPEVELLNFNKPAIIRCTLYQIDIESPHPHSLVICSKDAMVRYDPHDVELSLNKGYVAQFRGIGIIRTTRNFITEELLAKKKKRLLFQQGCNELSTKQLHELKMETDREITNLNFNKAKFFFEAFHKENNHTYTRIAAPVYSNIISNLKSAQTSKLCICRLSIATGSVTGGDELILLVGKVDKKDIKVRFYELNSKDEVIWQSYGKFEESDVHNQCAIVCITPEYKNRDIEQPVDINIELVRPSDGKCSNTTTIRYKPRKAITSRKRARFVPQNTNSSFNAIALEYSVKQLAGCHTNTLETDSITSTEAFNKHTKKELEQIIKVYAKTRTLKNFFDQLPLQLVATKVNNIYNEYTERNNDSLLHDIIINDNIEDFVQLCQIIKYFKLNYLIQKTNEKAYGALHYACLYNHAQYIQPLLALGCNPNLQDCHGNTALHIAVKKEHQTCIERFLNSNQGLTIDLNIRNDDGLTVLHIAICERNYESAEKLLKHNPAAAMIGTMKQGNTALHLAVMQQHLQMINLILANQHIVDALPNRRNMAGRTAIDLAQTYRTKVGNQILNQLTTFVAKNSLLTTTDYGMFTSKMYLFNV